MSEAPAGRARLWLVAKVVGVALLIALPIWGRSIAEGRAELGLAQQARAQGELDEAIVHYGRAARWRTPLAGHDERSLEALLELADEAAAARPARALAAFREVRGALLATRIFGVPERESFDRANAGIAGLMARQEGEAGTDIGHTGDPEAFHSELLADVPGPNPVLTALSSAMFLLFVLSCVGMFRYGMDEHAKPVPRQAVRFGLAIVLSFAAWLVVLRFS